MMNFRLREPSGQFMASLDLARSDDLARIEQDRKDAVAELRDRMAMTAPHEEINNLLEYGDECYLDKVCAARYLYADAMLAAREKV